MVKYLLVTPTLRQLISSEKEFRKNRENSAKQEGQEERRFSKKITMLKTELQFLVDYNFFQRKYFGLISKREMKKEMRKIKNFIAFLDLLEAYEESKSGLNKYPVYNNEDLSSKRARSLMQIQRKIILKGTKLDVQRQNAKSLLDAYERNKQWEEQKGEIWHRMRKTKEGRESYRNMKKHNEKPKVLYLNIPTKAHGHKAKYIRAEKPLRLPLRRAVAKFWKENQYLDESDKHLMFLIEKLKAIKTHGSR
ncbi:MAG: hypothetical protein HZB67_00910 [Candidatus Aenigmarchaeota archaeon]|nr:hypothetical protein [Candidatus Aenigmarchaeota archaeon]